jgi:hypothetical protein
MTSDAFRPERQQAHYCLGSLSLDMARTWQGQQVRGVLSARVYDTTRPYCPPLSDLSLDLLDQTPFHPANVPEVFVPWNHTDETTGLFVDLSWLHDQP